jgi:hypothetical protein
MRFLALLLVLPSLSALLMQPRLGAVRAPCAAVRPSINMQFGEPEKSGLTRDNEPEEFFASSFDDMPDAEKIKSPAVIGGLVILIAPFIVGAIALAFYR